MSNTKTSLSFNLFNTSQYYISKDHRLVAMQAHLTALVAAV